MPDLSAFDHDTDAKEFLTDLINQGGIEGAALGITKKIREDGYSSLSDKQKYVFHKEVEEHYIFDQCGFCGDVIPWTEMIYAFDNGGYCGHCQHIQNKIDTE